MTNEEKLSNLKIMIEPDTASDALLVLLLDKAKEMILHRRYGAQYDLTLEVPTQYEYLQLDLVVEMFSKRGAEGETSHSENGISRTYENGHVSTSLLKKVTPLVGSVITRR